MLNVSIVLYNHSVADIEHLVKTLCRSENIYQIYLIDNSPVKNPGFTLLGVNYVFNNKNIGYGAANNIAIKQSIQNKIPYHLVINPDIALEPAALKKMIDFMSENTDVGLLMPKIVYPNGETQYLCKLLPSPADLILRRFLPDFFSKKSNHRFEMRESGYDKIMEVPYLSGCFMFFRTKVLEEVGLFDERFFMYPEDIDITRRIYGKYKTIFYPYVKVIHNHEKGSYKNSRLLKIHLLNMAKYFNKWGWFFDPERKKINKEILRKLKLL